LPQSYGQRGIVQTLVDAICARQLRNNSVPLPPLICVSFSQSKADLEHALENTDVLHAISDWQIAGGQHQFLSVHSHINTQIITVSVCRGVMAANRISAIHAQQTTMTEARIYGMKGVSQSTNAIA
jgi:hypothetical protein